MRSKPSLLGKLSPQPASTWREALTMTDEELFNDSAAHATVLAKALGKTEETGEITMSVNLVRFLLVFAHRRASGGGFFVRGNKRLEGSLVKGYRNDPSIPLNPWKSPLISLNPARPWNGRNHKRQPR